MSRVARDSLLTGPAALEPGERLVTSFRADHAVYIRNMMIVMLVAGAVLALAETLRGAAYPWAIPAFAICMIGLRAWHMAGLAMSLEWQLTDRRLIGPGGRVIPLAEISAVRNILGTVLVMQKGAKPAVIRFHPYPKGVIAALTAASTGGAAMTPLLPGEQVLWQGRPGGGVPADLSNPGRLLFGFAFVAFSLFWMDKAMASGPIWLGGLPFLFIGLKLSVWQAWAPRLRAKVAVYRLTETRVLVDLVWPLIGTRSVVMSPGPSTIVERSGDPATITLRHQVAGPRGNATESLTLLRLDEADHVMALIRQMQRNAA